MDIDGFNYKIPVAMIIMYARGISIEFNWKTAKGKEIYWKNLMKKFATKV